MFYDILSWKSINSYSIILGEESSKSIHGEAGETIGNFNAELEGSAVCLTGIVAESKIDLAYVDEYEKKVHAAIEEEKEEADMEHKEGVGHHAGLEKIAKWKEEIAKDADKRRKNC